MLTRTVHILAAMCQLNGHGLLVKTKSEIVPMEREEPPVMAIQATELPPIRAGRDRNGSMRDVRFPVKRDRSRRHVSLRDHRGGRHGN